MVLELWSEQTLRISVEGPDGSSRVTVDKPFALVGGDDRSDIVLTDESIPSRKLYLQATPEGVFCLDLAPGPPGQTQLHGWLSPERPLSLGPYSIRVALGDGTPGNGGSSRPPLDTAGSLPEPRPQLVARHQGKEIGRGRVTRQLSVLGRKKPSSMIIKSHAISGCHCALVWVSNECWAVDLLSANGTYIDDRLVQAAKLHPGETLRLGEVEILYLLPEGAVASMTAESSAAEAVSEFVHSDEFALDAARLREQASLPQQQPEADRAALAARQEALETERTQQEDDLCARQAEFSRQMETWEAARQQEEEQLAERAERLEAEAAKRAAEAADLQTQRTAFAAEAERLREQASLHQQQLEADRAALAARQEALERERTQHEDDLCARQAALERERTQHEDDLCARQAEFSRQMETWEAARQQEEKRLAERAERLEVEAAKRAAEAADLQNQRTAFAAEAAGLREHATLQQQQLEADRAVLAARQEALETERTQHEEDLCARQAEFRRQADTWEAARQQEEKRLAEQAKQLEAEAAKRAGEAAELQSERAAFAAEAASVREDLNSQQRKLEADRARFVGEQEAVEKELRGRSDELRAQQVEFSRQTATWEAARQQDDRRWAEATKQLEAEAAKIAAEAACMELRRVEFAAEAAELREQMDLQRRQLETDRARFAGQQEAVEKSLEERSDALRAQQADLGRPMATWKGTCEQEDGRLAGIAEQQQVDGAETEDRAALTSNPAASPTEPAQRPDLSPRQTEVEGHHQGLAAVPTEHDPPTEEEDPLTLLRRTWQQKVDQDRYATLRSRLPYCIAVTAGLVVFGALIWWTCWL
jgi:pSer/pThr/pTyr-binding forkhead associated (FHA) protein